MLSDKGKQIMKSMRKTYRNKRKAEEVFWASKNAGKIKGVEEKGKK